MTRIGTTMILVIEMDSELRGVCWVRILTACTKAVTHSGSSGRHSAAPDTRSHMAAQAVDPLPA